MIGLDTSVVTIALPDIRAGLHLGTGGLAWVQNSYMLAFGGLLLLGGRTGDVLGRRRVFGAGVALFTAASLLGGLATAGWALLLARSLQGVAAAVAAPSAMALIAASFEGAARVRALSVFSAVIGAGGALGMVVGGALTEAASWHWVFFVNVPIGAALLLALPRALPHLPPNPGPFDAAGALAATAGMTAVVYGLIRASGDGWGDARVLASLAGGAVLLAVFVAVEARAPRPLMPLRLLADRERAGAYAAQLLAVAAMFGSFFFLTQRIQHDLGYGPLRAGFAFVPTVGLQFVTVRLVPRLLPRFGVRTLVATGLAAITAALAILAATSPDGGYAATLLVPFVLLGVGGGLTIMPLNAAILGRAPVEDAGAASGIAQTMLWTGASVGTAVLVTVHGAAPGAAVYATAAAFAAAGVVLALLTLRPRPRP
ncbi:MFS transporter [Actinomadura sp. PM05-2]|uniref:MFS transporter n=2 Tax=Actinomadura parmotrematis TaxID=2864039 RepID=A0ABS7FYI7_9ACTN|nr:MFS transporter [Actinomadura parmotrematis]